MLRIRKHPNAKPEGLPWRVYLPHLAGTFIVALAKSHGEAIERANDLLGEVAEQCS